MTNYKRFVSYFYQYDSGRKNNNTGYARIETSDELCKVSLNCNLRTIPGRICRVYFVKRNRDQAEGILVGTAITKADGVEARLTMPKGVMEDTKVRFYDITGIVVCFSKDNYFVTEWDNIPITYHQVASFEAGSSGKPEDVKEKVEVVKQPLVIEVVDTASEKVIEVVEVQPENARLNDKITEGVLDTKERIKDTELITDDVVVEGEEFVAKSEGVVEDTEKQGEEIEEGNIEQSIHATIELDENDLKAATVAYVPTETEVIYEATDVEKDSVEEAIGLSTEEEFKVSSIEVAEPMGDKEVLLEEDELVLDDNDGLVNAADCDATPSVPEKEGWCDHPSARSILDRFPHMYPFDDGEITECVRIEPKDLGLLPIDAWTLGNNSFILHSFCTYRHLLFAKKMSRDGIYYMVMVPGAYNAREKHMASMFGFKDFKCSRRRKLRDGDFGYWYVYIDYSNVYTC